MSNSIRTAEEVNRELRLTKITINTLRHMVAGTAIRVEKGAGPMFRRVKLAKHYQGSGITIRVGGWSREFRGPREAAQFLEYRRK